MKYTYGFSQTKIKRLLYDLLRTASLEFYTIETIGRFIEFNRSKSRLNSTENKTSENDLWLNNEQIRLITHKLYSQNLYDEIILPFLNGDYHEELTINDILTYLDNNIEYEQEQVIDVQDMKTKLTILP